MVTATRDNHSHDLPDTSSAAAEAHDHSNAIQTYLMVFGALMVLLLVTVLATLLHLGAFNIVLAMAIAVVKAILVGWYFMHINYASKLTKIFAISAFIWLGIMFAMTFGDFLTRGHFPEAAKDKVIESKLIESR